MKTFRFIGMALLAVVMCVNFTACSSDDDEGDAPIKNDDGIITNQKRLVEINETYKDDTSVMTFSYDSKGRLITVIRKDYDSNGNGDITNYTWNGKTIVSEDKYRTRTYTLNNGLVSNLRDNTGDYDWNNISFSYNSSEQVIETKDIYERDTYTTNYIWENGKYMGTNEDNNANNVTYSGKSCKGYFPLYGIIVFGDVSDDVDILYTHPELLGMRNDQLPDQSYNKEIEKSEYYDDHFKETYKNETIYDESIKYTYKLNNDGYVESVIIVETDLQTYKYSFQDKNGDGVISDDERNITDTHTDTSTTVYTFKWE